MKLKNKKNCLELGRKILVTGGGGFLGRYVVDNLINKRKLSPKDIFTPRRIDCDLRLWPDCQKAVAGQDVVIHLAAKVGGTDFQLNYPAEIFYENLIMGVQLLEAARQAGVKKFVFIGSIGSYPSTLKPPFQEKDFNNGSLAENTTAYGLAKKILLNQARAYRQQYGMETIYLILPNLYGIGLENSHALPIFIKKIKEAIAEKKQRVEFWGTGRAKREFLHATDAAELILLATENYDSAEPLNLGPGKKITTGAMVKLIVQSLKFKGQIQWDNNSKKNQKDRYLNSQRVQKLFKFKPQINFKNGLRQMINHYESQN